MDEDKLRALAEAATPGERYLTEQDGAIHAGDSNGLRTIGDVDFGDDDIAFTLAASPDRVIALLDRLDMYVAHAERVDQVNLDLAADALDLRQQLAAANAEIERLADERHQVGTQAVNMLTELNAMETRLAAVWAARDEACDEAAKLILVAPDMDPDDVALTRDRLAELRKVGAHE